VYQKPVTIRHNARIAELKGPLWKRISHSSNSFSMRFGWKNLAENTLSAYRRDLTMLVEWLAHRELSLESVNMTICRHYSASVWTGATKQPAPHAC
jgi:integrase/recombinase XerD